jgi:hypothetical protein
MTKAKAVAKQDVANNAAEEFDHQPIATLNVPNADLVTDALVREVEKRVMPARRNPVDFINAETRGVLVLFPYEPQNRREGVTYPVMKGHIDTRNVRCLVSAFAHVTEEGREYISLSVGVEGQDHIGGAMYRHEVQNAKNGAWGLTPGKENLRFGLIVKSVCINKIDEEYDIVFQLQVNGKRQMSGAGVPYIKAAFCRPFFADNRWADRLRKGKLT